MFFVCLSDYSVMQVCHVLCVSFRLFCDAGLPCSLCVFQTILWCRFAMFFVCLSDYSVMQVCHVLCVSFRLFCDAGLPCSLCVFQTILWCRFAMFFVCLSDYSVMQVCHVLCVSFRLFCDAGLPCSLCVFQTILWCRFAMFFVCLSDCSVMQVCSICTCDQDLKQVLRATELLTNIATYSLKGNSTSWNYSKTCFAAIPFERSSLLRLKVYEKSNTHCFYQFAEILDFLFYVVDSCMRKEELLEHASTATETLLVLCTTEVTTNTANLLKVRRFLVFLLLRLVWEKYNNNYGSKRFECNKDLVCIISNVV